MNTQTPPHIPVMLNEAIQGLAINPDGIYIDATFGRGGHSSAILKQLSDKGKLIAIDQDKAAIESGKSKFNQEPRIELLHSPFSQIKSLSKQYGCYARVNGVLFDLGVSSPQLDDPERGFSFQKNGPLDMRMNQERGVTAEKWLSSASEKQIASILTNYGEERYAGRIARAIVSARQQVKLNSTGLLAAIIKKVVPTYEKDKHPATRTFQAIRIYINRELDELNETLERVVEVLAPGGRLVIISFHSLEDRIVKRFIREEVKGDPFPSALPIGQGQLVPRLKLIAKKVKPSEQEIAANPRSRSAIMRIAEKLS